MFKDKALAGQMKARFCEGRIELHAPAPDSSDARRICVTRVRRATLNGTTYRLGNARKLLAGWNAIDALRSEDLTACARMAESQEDLEMPDAVRRVVFAVIEAIRAANAVSIADPEGKDTP